MNLGDEGGAKSNQANRVLFSGVNGKMSEDLAFSAAVPGGAVEKGGKLGIVILRRSQECGRAQPGSPVFASCGG